MLLLPARASRTARVFSFGGGVQSHAVLVMQALGMLQKPYDMFIFANVGHDSENPETLAFIEKYTKPYAEQHNITFIEVRKMRGRGKNKTPDTLLANIHRQQKSFVIPVRMGHNGAPGNRNCTEDYKITVVDNAIKALDYTHAFVGVGISTDEAERMKSTSWYDDNRLAKRREYPLIEARMSRHKCLSLIASVGLPEPPKSSCWFCPFKKRSEWIEMKRNDPERFAQAVSIEKEMNRKRLAIHRDPVFLHPDCVPLEHAVGDQPTLFPAEVMDVCDSGFCWT